MVTVTPVPSQSGTATLTITVKNNALLTASSSFLLTVNGVPTISAIPNQTIQMNGVFGPQSFTIGDAAVPGTPPALLNLTATASTNLALAPLGNIVFGGSGASPTLMVTPVGGKYGTPNITITVENSVGLTTSTTFTLTVNSPPTISTLNDIYLAQNTVSSAKTFNVSDNESAATALVLGKASSDTNVIPLSGIALTKDTSGNCTVTLTPATGQSGASTITLSVSDPDGGSASTSFNVYVGPSITAIPDQLIAPNASFAAYPLIISDPVTSVSSLSQALTAQSNNTALVPVSRISFGGVGTNSPTLTVTPLTGQTGKATITITVKNAANLTAATSFVLTVDTTPTISAIADQAASAGAASAPIAFTISAVGAPVVTAVSSNQTLLPNANISLGGSGTSRNVIVTPPSGEYGTAIITITVTDSLGLSASTSFNLLVTAISAIANQTVNQGQAAGPYSFTIGGAVLVGDLAVTADSTNISLLPLANISLAGSGNGRTVTLTPVATQAGSSTVTLTVTDTGNPAETANTSFVLTVSPTNNTPPAISTIADQSISANTSTAPLPFTVGDLETPLANLVLTALSSNPALVPVSNIVFSGIGTNRTVTVTPATGLSGAATITLIVTDGGGLSASSSFTLTVANSAPAITGTPIVSPNPAAVGQTVTFTAAATDTGDIPLTYTWNPGDGTAIITGATATHVYTASGDYTVTLAVTDRDRWSSPCLRALDGSRRRAGFHSRWRNL